MVVREQCSRTLIESPLGGGSGQGCLHSVSVFATGVVLFRGEHVRQSPGAKLHWACWFPAPFFPQTSPSSALSLQLGHRSGAVGSSGAKERTATDTATSATAPGVEMSCCPSRQLLCETRRRHRPAPASPAWRR